VFWGFRGIHKWVKLGLREPMGIGHASNPILTSLFLSRLEYVSMFGVVSLILLAATAFFSS
jgi:hypothetical protein